MKYDNYDRERELKKSYMCIEELDELRLEIVNLYNAIRTSETETRNLKWIKFYKWTFTNRVYSRLGFNPSRVMSRGREKD